jgi:hypothetical protein
MGYRQPSLFADFLYSMSPIRIGKNDPKLQFYGQTWPFILRIQDSRSKRMERMYNE